MFGEATLNREDLPFWPAPGEAVAVDIPSQYWSLLIIRLESDDLVWRLARLYARCLRSRMATVH